MTTTTPQVHALSKIATFAGGIFARGYRSSFENCTNRDPLTLWDYNCHCWTSQCRQIKVGDLPMV